MIENRAAGTNDDIPRRKHAPQGKKVKKTFFQTFFIYLFFILFFDTLIKIYRVGRVNRVGRVTPIKPFFLGLIDKQEEI